MDYVTNGIEGLRVVAKNKIMGNEILLFVLALFVIVFVVSALIFLVNNIPLAGVISLILAGIFIFFFNQAQENKSYTIELKVIPEEAKYFIDADIWEITNKEGEIITLISKEVFEGDNE